MKRTQKHSPLLVIAFLAFALLASIALAGCSGKTLEGSDREAILAYSEPIADNLLQGLNSGDYAIFSRDFDSLILKGISAQVFSDNFLPTIVGKLGKYVSRQVDSVTESGSNVVIVYTAKFDNDDNVTVSLSLELADPHHVSGLHFKSPTLSQ